MQESTKATGRRWITIAVFVIPLLLTVLVEQGYVKYNPYILPVAIVCMLFCLVGRLLCSQISLKWLNSFHTRYGTKKPALYHLGTGSLMALVVIGILAIGLVTLSKSEDHVNQLRLKESASVKSPDAAPPEAKPSPQPSPKSIDPKVTTPLPRAKVDHPKAPVKAAPIPAPVVTTETKPVPTPLPPIQNCPGGICNGGDNSGIQTVYNIGNLPPQPRQILTAKATPALAILRGVPGSSVRFTVIGSTGDIAPFSNNLMGFFNAGNWRIVMGSRVLNETTNTTIYGSGLSVSNHGEGVRCYSNNWDSAASVAALKALEVIGFPCVKDADAVGPQTIATLADFYISIGPP